MKNCDSTVLAVSLCAMALMMASCAMTGGKAAVRPLPDLIGQNKGNVVVALLGMKGCQGTEKATAFLSEFSATKPAGVKVCRVDVPLQGRSLKRADNVGSGIDYRVDDRRTAAEWFEFFFYPTLYIVDREGVVRFAGDCEPEKVKDMVAGILSETSGAPKKMYTQPLVAVNETIPDFRIPDIDNKETSLSSLCKSNGVILLFSATTCGFSVDALSDLETLEKDFKCDKLGYVIVGFGQDANAVRDVYSKKSPGATVVIDADKSISAKHFGVSAVPFFYLLDQNRVVKDRRPFVYGTAKAAVAKALGKGDGAGCGEASGAG
mgnify:CR=1 FL=1